MVNPNVVSNFWLEEIGPSGWYRGGEELNAQIRSKFQGIWEQALAGELCAWQTKPDTMLSFLILTDQFPRNMFRGQAKAFATDKLARAAAKQAIHHEWDLRVPEPARQFFYLPLMHSECLTDQDRCVRLMLTRMPETGEDNLLHAKAHREIIRLFGRFPFRNTALARSSRDEEQDFIEQGGYGRTLEELRT